MTAHKGLCPIAEKPHHFFPIVPEAILHVFGSTGLGPGEGIADIDRAFLCPGSQFGFVERILVGMAAADEEQRGSHFAPCFEQSSALLDEATEGRDAGAGCDHDQRGIGHVGGEVEGRVRGFDVDVDVVARLDFGEEVGGDADEAFAGALESVLVEEAKG